MLKTQGLSLMEVLISLVILSLALLGFDAFEIDALHKIRNAYYAAIASEQLYSMAERLQSHTIEQYPEQIRIWSAENELLLPASRGLVTFQQSPFQITLFWGQKTNKKTCQESNKGLLHCLSMPVFI